MEAARNVGRAVGYNSGSLAPGIFRVPPGTQHFMRRFILILVVLGVVAACVDAIFIEPYRIEVTHNQVQAPIARPLKIAHLSDLHTAGLGRRELRLLELLSAEQPDVIVITGDSLTRGFQYEKIRPLLSRLQAPLGVWLVRGNWENQYPMRLERERLFYSQLGIHFLLNEARPLRDDVWLAGLDDPSTGAPNMDLALSTVPHGAYVIALFHAPGYFDQVSDRVPLVLAGHTHGGQIRLPFVPVFWKPRDSGRYLEGWYRERGSQMYVSRGIGTSFLPIRFRCRPELSIITVSP
jgi:predicted MPP superfamily phosphohydrolase